jgi:hypothetical protein
LTHTKTDSKFFFVQEHTFEEEDDDEPVVDEQTPTVDEQTPATLPTSESVEAAAAELLQEGFALVEVGLYLRK